MIAESYCCKRELKEACKYFLSFLILFTLSGQFVQAQDLTGQTRSLRQAAPEKTNLSEAALSRMSAAITATRQEKLTAGAATNKSFAQEQALGAIRSSLGFNAAVTSYSNGYFDTQSGDDFSFPEDTHDYCRAYFGSDVAMADYYLNASLNVGESLVATLTWDNPADYDLYIFDTQGYPVGDADPLADFDGANGTDTQTNTTPLGSLLEEATISHSRPAADSDEFVVVIDRFRGAVANTLSLSISGNDDAFVVLEYVLGDDFSYVNAVTDEIVGPLTDGISINLDQLGSPRPNFNVQFNTDGCAQSIAFTLVNETTGETVTTFTDNESPYALFGDDNGDFNASDLADGNYTLIATPYSGDDGTGASADPQTVNFDIVSDGPTGIESFSLIDAAADAPIAGFDPIVEGSVVDLVALFNDGIDISRLNIQANVSDPDGQIEQVDTDLAITLLNGDAQAVTNMDDGADYSVYGDDNAGDFADATLPLGAYGLTGTPQAGGAALDPTSVNFTVIGPRIGSYTLINADTEQPIDGTGGFPDFDPIPEGAVIDMSALGVNVNIRANTVDYTPPVIESTLLNVQGPNGTIQNRVESFRPYAVFGDPTSMDLEDNDPNLDYNNWQSIQSGSYSISGIPFSLNGGVGDLYGALVLNFSITNAAAGAAELGIDEPTLLPNYPNPFNPVTAIRFSLPEDAPVKLEVFDMLGRVVKVLVDGTLKSGFHEVNFEASELSSGMYLYKLETPGAVKVRPMTLLK
ncbi:MAG: T9SS type A sorting domain-containing protein [Rhodothermales bacterium]